MKIATWNVNSLKVRLPQVLDWLAKHPDIDALCLQELKMTDDVFPLQAFTDNGYQAVFTGQKTYNGVAIISKAPLTGIQMNLPNFPDEQRRVIAGTLGDTRIVCVYIPNGQALDSDKFPYKLAWLDALIAYLKDELKRTPNLVLAGDYNIAPSDDDVHDPAAWVGQNLVSEPERSRFQALLDLGLIDSYRAFAQAPKSFTWWDYRMLGFQKNKGLRIDHLLISEALKPNLLACEIDRAPRKLPQPSDHTPVIVSLSDA